MKMPGGICSLRTAENSRPMDAGEFTRFASRRIAGCPIRRGIKTLIKNQNHRRSRIRSPSSFRYGAVGRAPFSVRKIIKIIHSARTISNAF